MEMDDFDFNEEEQQQINLQPRRARESAIHFVESAVRSPVTYNKEEALRRYAQEKLKEKNEKIC